MERDGKQYGVSRLMLSTRWVGWAGSGGEKGVVVNVFLVEPPCCHHYPTPSLPCHHPLAPPLTTYWRKTTTHDLMENEGRKLGTEAEAR